MTKNQKISKLKQCRGVVDNLEKTDNAELKKIMMNIEGIVSSFNLAKYLRGNPLELNNVEHKQVKDILESVWSIAENKGMTISIPEPDLTYKIG